MQRVSKTLESELVLAQDDGKSRKHSDLAFEALAMYEGGYQNLTKSARGAVNKALAEIREVCPNVTAKEIQHRAGSMRREFGKNVPITACGIARHWARLA